MQLDLLTEFDKQDKRQDRFEADVVDTVKNLVYLRTKSQFAGLDEKYTEYLTSIIGVLLLMLKSIETGNIDFKGLGKFPRGVSIAGAVEEEEVREDFLRAHIRVRSLLLANKDLTRTCRQYSGLVIELFGKLTKI